MPVAFLIYVFIPVEAGFAQGTPIAPVMLGVALIVAEIVVIVA